MIGEYNSQRSPIILKEYGRNVQKLVDHIRSVPDKEKRTEMATTLLELIKQLAPVGKDNQENPQRMWDDLFVIANFDMDINSPYPMPERDILFKKPKRMPYPQENVRWKHYGKNIERLVKEVLKDETIKDKEEAVIYLGKLMKTFYSNWNKEMLDDSVILKDIKAMSDGQLTMNIEKVREDNLFEKLYRDKKKPFQHGQGGGGGGGQRHQGGKRPFNKNRHNPHRRRDS
ncbi:MAG: DUF4290 domain-containing protein [Cyclobacteriaceae bacterium]|jgi:hypothetical protein